MIMIAGHQVSDAMFSYIACNIDADTCKLLLKDEPGLTFDKSFAILQIECRRKARNKIPELLRHSSFLFPKAISAEQCTHETVAQFHASLFESTDRVLDMTMGLGVDDYYLSKRVGSLTAVELDAEIAAVGKHNFEHLAPSVDVVEGDSVEYLRACNCTFDAIFIDPARRGDCGKRLYGLADCQPNVLNLLTLIKQHCNRLYIKASPMLDVTQSMLDLGMPLSDLWAVSIKNECKELLFKLDFNKGDSQVRLHALNHTGNEWQQFTTIASDEMSSAFTPALAVEGAYLYEPNASVMKLGCYDALQQDFGIPLVSRNSHLMIGSEFLAQFPGRRFIIKEVIPFKDKNLKALGKRMKQANVTTRNFRLSADALKQRLRIKDGGSTYIFATTLASGDQVLIACEKV